MVLVLLEGPRERAQPVYEGEARPLAQVLLDGLHGVEVRGLACGVEGPWIEITFSQVIGKLSLFTQQQTGTRLSSELGKV